MTIMDHDRQAEIIDNADTKVFSFADTFIEPDFVVCGIRLRPFSMGHWAFLEKYHFPLMEPDTWRHSEKLNWDESMHQDSRHILLFILVCAHTFEENTRMLEDNDYFHQSAKQIEEVVLQYADRHKSFNLYRVIVDINQYLTYYAGEEAMPHFVEIQPHNSPSSGTDYRSNLYMVMKKEYKYSNSEILNMSLRRLNAEWVTFGEKMGAVRVKSKQEIMVEANAQKMVQDILAGRIKLDATGSPIIPKGEK